MTEFTAHLHSQRCFHHAGREAVARCPACHQFYCRECITEHDNRVMCSSCLNLLLRPPSRPAWVGRTLLSLTHFILGLALLWLLFATLGQILIALPSSFHEGTVWQDNLEPQ